MTRAKSSKKGFEFRYTPYHLRDCFGVRTSVLASTTSRVLQQEKVLDPPSSIFVTKCHQHSGENCATNILELAIIRANITTRRKPLLNTNVDLYRRGKKKKKNYKLKFTTPGFPTFTAQSNHQPALCDLCPFPPGGFELHRGHASGFHTAQITQLRTLCKAIRAV